MYTVLNCGTIGVTCRNLDHALSYAQEFGFQAVEINPREVAGMIDENGLGAVREKFLKIKAAAWSLPRWNGDEPEYREALRELPRDAKAAAQVGATRVFTWIMPSSNDRTYEENAAFHRERLGPIAKILADHGCSLGLEFIGPKTSRDRGAHVFIYEALPMLEFAKTIGPNMGVMLDSWHWYTSGGTVADIEKLKPEDIVYIHVNDAPIGVDRDEHQDHIRSVPGATGVIDIAGFLGALKKIGYDGPICPEPFTSELNSLMDDAQRLNVVREGLLKILATVS